MTDIVFDPSLIHSDNQVGNIREIVIKKYSGTDTSHSTWLGEVLTEIPHGLVNKTETGMGATTLEFNTPRNSIIVEPIKITASSKAYKHDALYIGSPTKFHPTKNYSGEISRYLNDKTIKYKKIVVVADSLYRVIDRLKQTAFNNYFLLLDEIDSFQLDSSYRLSMEECIDFYKQFKKENRALLSATLIDFSDPEIKSEPITSLKYDQPVKRDIKLFITDPRKLVPGVVEQVIRIHSKDPYSKIFVAYNSVSGCYNIAEYLKLKQIFDEGEIGILCSTNSKDKVGSYYRELNSEELPTKMNLVTSAYFTGFDIMEQYHLISVSGNMSRIHALSDKRLKQISGRCRLGLLSETIIHDVANNTDVQDTPIVDDVISAAFVQIDSLKCIKKHFEKNELLKRNFDDISENLVRIFDESGKSFIRKVGKGEYAVAHLKIDAYIENSRVRNTLYLLPNSLTDALVKDGHNVVVRALIAKTSVTSKDLVKLDRTSRIKEIIELLRGVTCEDDLRDLQEDLKRFDSNQKKIIEYYSKFYKNLEPCSFLDELEATADCRDSRALNSLMFAASFLILPDGEVFKSRVYRYFPIGQTFNAKEILKRWNIIFGELSMSTKFSTEVQAVRALTSLFKTKRALPDNSRRIVGTNTHNLIVINMKEEIVDLVEGNRVRGEFLT